MPFLIWRDLVRIERCILRQLKHHLKGFDDRDEGSGGDDEESGLSAPLKIIGAIESLVQQIEDEKNQRAQEHCIFRSQWMRQKFLDQPRTAGDRSARS